MINPLIILIQGYLRQQNRSCSLVDLVNLCEQDFPLLIGKNVDLQVVIFQKNFFIMNALYQIQHDIQNEGFSLSILPLDICMVPNRVEGKCALTKRDTELARYYLDWSNLTSITVEEIEELFSSFWQRYRAIDKVEAALTTLGLDQNVDWYDVRKAYKRKIAISHPDKGGRAHDFIKIHEAYKVLSFSYHEA